MEVLAAVEPALLGGLAVLRFALTADVLAGSRAWHVGDRAGTRSDGLMQRRGPILRATGLPAALKTWLASGL